MGHVEVDNPRLFIYISINLQICIQLKPSRILILSIKLNSSINLGRAAHIFSCLYSLSTLFIQYFMFDKNIAILIK